MAEEYYLEFSRYSLQRYKDELEQADIIPSRRILKEKIGERFGILEKNGIKNLQDLQDQIKTTKKAKEFAEKTGLPEEYVLILRREINSLKPRPVLLDRFPGISQESLNKLGSVGIKNTYQLFKHIKTPEDRKFLAMEVGISEDEVLVLTKLTDLSRVKWIGPIFARIFLESGADTVEKLKDSDPAVLYKELVTINREKEYTKAKFVANDVNLCVKMAHDVPSAIKY